MNDNKTSQKQRTKRPGNFAEALMELGGRRLPRRESKEKSEDQLRIEALKRSRHAEVINTPVFNREDEEIKKKIDEIQEELKGLAKEIVAVGAGIDKAIHEQSTNPGTYHLSFFEALRRYLIQLRKKASESKNWLAISAQRKQSQNHYWGNVKKSGTRYMLSQERTPATQAG